MSVLKFRAWDKRFNNMVYGSPMAILYLNNSDHEIMQGTGLLDKSGKEIYEGDILKPYSIEASKLEVFWFDQYSRFSLRHYPQWLEEKNDNSLNSVSNIGDESHTKYCEIIGNIYENPELLK